MDVTIVSQESSGAGQDCVATAHAGKFTRYATAVRDWGHQGIVLQPMVWSNEGRSHPDVQRIMAFTSRAIACKTGRPATCILQRWRADVGVLLAVRRARMARACPRVTHREWYIMGGALDEEAGMAAQEELEAYLVGGDELAEETSATACPGGWDVPQEEEEEEEEAMCADWET